MAKKSKIQDPTHRIFETAGKMETVENLKNWCNIDATYGKIPLPEQLKSAAKVYKDTREFAALIMLDLAAEVR